MHPLDLFFLETLSDYPHVDDTGARLKRLLKALLSERKGFEARITAASVEVEEALLEAERAEDSLNSREKELEEELDELRKEFENLQDAAGVVRAAL